MNTHHLPLTTPQDERRLIWSALLKYLAVMVAYVGLLVIIGQNQTTLDAIRDTQTEGSPLLLAIQAQQDEIERAANAAVAGQEQLADCLDPEGECAREQAQRSARYVQVFSLTVFCSARYTDLPESEAYAATNDCVARLTKRVIP